MAGGIERRDDAPEETAVEFPPALDLVAPLVGAVGLIAAAVADGGPHPLAIARTLAGAAFLGAVSDAMLLGHWYLVQPGLGRAPLNQLVNAVAISWPVEVATLLWPTGMAQVLDGTVDDKWQGTLGWFWVACAVTSIALTFVTKAALREISHVERLFRLDEVAWVSLPSLTSVCRGGTDRRRLIEFRPYSIGSTLALHSPAQIRTNQSRQ